MYMIYTASTVDYTIAPSSSMCFSLAKHDLKIDSYSPFLSPYPTLDN